MNELILFFVMAFFCNGNKHVNQFTIETTCTTLISTDNNKDQVQFDFKANYINTNTIEITASLYNDNSDTVYLLTSTCDGMQYSLQYDTLKFILTPFLNCNASYPSIAKISPKGHIEFKAQFRCKLKEREISLGFDFYQVEKSFDLTKIKLYNIYNRPAKGKNIKWLNRPIE